MPSTPKATPRYQVREGGVYSDNAPAHALVKGVAAELLYKLLNVLLATCHANAEVGPSDLGVSGLGVGLASSVRSELPLGKGVELLGGGDLVAVRHKGGMGSARPRQDGPYQLVVPACH